MEPFDLDQYLPNLSIDCVIFGYRKKELKVLVSQFKYTQNTWALPGGYVQKTEGTDQAAERILKERTHLDQIYLEQFRVFGQAERIVGSPDRDRMRKDLTAMNPGRYSAETIDWISSRFVSIGYYALVDMDKVNPQAGPLESQLAWVNVRELPRLIHDHNTMVNYALEALRQNLDRQLIGFKLLPETFTMRELKELYEAVYEKAFPMNNFQKKMLDLKVLTRLGKKFTGGQHRAPYLYTFKNPA